MAIAYVLLWMLLILVVGGWLVSRQSRKLRQSVRQLAAELGFEMLEGMAAVDRTIPPEQRQEALDAREKIPPALRGLVNRAAKGAMCLVGTSEGVPVLVYPDTRGSGRSSTTYTVVRAEYPAPLPVDLRIGSEGALTRLGKAVFSLRDVELGDPEFDRAVRVKSDDEAGARAVVGKPGARDAILGLLALSTSSYATKTYAQWEQQGRYFDPTKTRERLAAVVAVARSLGGN
jgi:hypothetical protein